MDEGAHSLKWSGDPGYWDPGPGDKGTRPDRAWGMGNGEWGLGLAYLCLNGALKLGVRVCAAIAVKYVCTKGNRQSHVCRKC